VAVAKTVTEAEELLIEPWSAIILDVMVPTTQEDEERGYSPDLTDHGASTGLAFYLRNRDYFVSAGIPVLVLTVRLDRHLCERFLSAGIHGSSFGTKYELSEPSALLRKLTEVIRSVRE
jgi:hypothetical protein